MNEKMTDEELERCYLSLERNEMPGIVTQFRAHIAALTAELDAYKRDFEAELDGNKGLRKTFGARDDETFPMFVERIVAERDAARDMLGKTATALNEALGAVVAEADALRERVKALEAEHDRETRRANTWRERADAAESRLAAMRQRAEDADMLEEKAQAAYSECGMGAVVMRRVSLAVARYIIGDDTPAPSEMAEAPQTDNLDTVEQWRENEEARAAPTTSEAFATVRRGWRVMEALEVPSGHSGDEESGQHDENCALCAHEALLSWSEDAAHALSLLERRMGALDRYAREVLATQGRNTREAIDAWNGLRSALTDAPPVFTLEEVVEGVAAYIGGGEGGRIAGRDVVERIKALRR